MRGRSPRGMMESGFKTTFLLNMESMYRGNEMITGWTAQALNTAPDSQNEIHGEVISKKYGFKGGLVPGVTISAYLIQPAVVAWGMDWLSRGTAHVRVVKPLYDKEHFEVVINREIQNGYEAEICNEDGTISATAMVSLAAGAPAAPVRRNDPIAEQGFVGPKASFESFERLKKSGCQAYRYRWGADYRTHAYLRDSTQMPPLLSPEGEGYAHMSFLLGCSNWILASNAQMNPWVHLETRSQNFRAVPTDTSIITEMAVLQYFEKKGHEFIDVNVSLFDEETSECLMTTFLRAIYKLRGT